MPTPKPGDPRAMKDVNLELMNFLDSACIALWHLPHFRDSMLAIQVCCLHTWTLLPLLGFHAVNACQAWKQTGLAHCCQPAILTL